MKYKAVGVHVFAGGFTMGVSRCFDVQCQLERHGFGLETCEQVMGVPTCNRKDGAWPDVEAQFAYGNPRCTAFSTITCGYAGDCHGPWAKQTADALDFCQYAAGRYDVAIWESVQQAYKVGKPLIDYLTHEVFAPKHYRVAHVFINAASFGNTQQRKRYFYVAYRDDRNFNITPPAIDPYERVAWDVLWDLRDRPTREWRLCDTDYDFDCHAKLTPDEEACVPHLPNGFSLNALARYGTDKLPPHYRAKWNTRTSDMPFSLHCIYRMQWLRPCPTIHSSAARWLHPKFNRTLTIGELATLMGWEGRIPAGRQPVAQIAKGVVPAVGEWLAEQAVSYLDDVWGDEDWESSYDERTGQWTGGDAHGKLEKVFDMTRYCSDYFDMDRFPVEVRTPCHILRV